jgi:1,4-alpha-glucan branching enzyme
MMNTKRKANNGRGKTPTPAPRPAGVATALPTPRGPGRVALEIRQPGAQHVCVAGSFNDWKPEQTPLAPAGDGRWVGALEVRPGRYEYLFVVDGQWLPDPNACESVENPYGGKNSVLMVSE